jgi:hypothetical protein
LRMGARRTRSFLIPVFPHFHPVKIAIAQLLHLALDSLRR